MRQHLQGHADRQVPEAVLGESPGLPSSHTPMETDWVTEPQSGIVVPHPQVMFQARCWGDKPPSRLHRLSLSHSLGFLASGHTGTFPGQQLMSCSSFTKSDLV